MPSGAVHPNTGNFSRVPRLSIVDRVRKLVAQNAYEKRPEWLQFVERAPPMELWNLKLREVRIKSPYPAMVRYVLDQFPDMRFQDCFVDGNDWSRGNDRYRDDHPVMQFVARQLQLMNVEGLDRKAAFEKTKEEYLERRFELEKKHKMEMALAQNQRVVPAFSSPLYTTGAAVARQREVELEVAHINHIRRKLRMLRKEIEPHDKRRMSAKEVALDVEAERTSYLPKILQSPYATPREEQELVSEEEEEQLIEEGEEAFEFLSPANDNEVVEPSIRDKFVRPVDVSELESVPSKSTTGVWDSFKEPETLLPSEGRAIPSPILQRKEVDPRRPASSVLKQASPSGFALSRPDRQTVKAILERKRKEEVEKRIGREPGASEDGTLDFEDFMNMIKNKEG